MPTDKTHWERLVRKIEGHVNGLAGRNAVQARQAFLQQRSLAKAPVRVSCVLRRGDELEKS